MRKITFICSLAALALVAVGCGDDDDAPAMTDGGVDAGGGTDLGRDMNPPPPRDLGAVDPCAAANAAAALDTFECNGPVEPPGAANALFGTCTEAVAVGDAGVDPAGSCTDSQVCFFDAPEGSPSLPFCLDTCTGATDGLYAQTGDCPAGSRCITAFFEGGPEGFCVPSCEVDADCASGFCDTRDNSCYFAPGEPPTDGGVPTDGGGADGGTTGDAGTDDGGVVDLDATVPTDATVSVDGGVDATVPTP